MKFKFKEQTKDGNIIDGVKEASDKFAVAKDIRDEGGIPLNVEQDKKSKIGSITSITIFSRITLEEKIIFVSNLSGMLSAGLSLTRALTVLVKQSTNQKMVDILNSLIDEVNKGGTLSSGLKKHPKVFSTVFVSMILSGEESGGLPRVLNELGVSMKKTYNLNKKIKGAMIYPSIIIGTIFIIGVLMMIYVVPTLVATFKGVGAKLPASTEAVIWLSDTLTHHLLLFILGVGVIVGGFIMFARMKSTKRYFDLMILHLPVIKDLSKETNSARTARTLSSLLSSGLDLPRALAITRDILSNVYYRELIGDSIKAVEKGIALSDMFIENTKLYPVMVGEMIQVGEETGKLSEMLLNIATFYEDRVDEKTKNLSSIIEPVLMLFIGSAVGFFAVSMITPIYSVMNNIH